MSSATQFETRVLHGNLFRLPEAGVLLPLCPFAQPFATWCEKLRAGLGDAPTDIQVNLALLDLQTKFFGWYAGAPLACRQHVAPHKPKVRCLMALYEEQYHALYRQALALTPPRLREVAPSALVPTRPVVQIEGITLGEILESGG